jgi:hypothetical protein
MCSDNKHCRVNSTSGTLCSKLCISETEHTRKVAKSENGSLIHMVAYDGRAVQFVARVCIHAVLPLDLRVQLNTAPVPVNPAWHAARHAAPTSLALHAARGLAAARVAHRGFVLEKCARKIIDWHPGTMTSCSESVIIVSRRFSDRRCGVRKRLNCVSLKQLRTGRLGRLLSGNLYSHHAVARIQHQSTLS